MSPGALRTWLEIQLWRHGLGWPLAILTLLTTAAVHGWVLRPEQARLQQAQRAPLTPAHTVRVAAQRPPGATLAEVQAAWPAGETASQAAGELVAVAQRHGLTVAQSEYQQKEHAALGMTQVQVSQPLRASYAQFRAYTQAVLRAHPNVSLDQVAARRDAAGGTLDLRLRWSFWLVDTKRQAPSAKDKP